MEGDAADDHRIMAQFLLWHRGEMNAQIFRHSNFEPYVLFHCVLTETSIMPQIKAMTAKVIESIDKNQV